MCDVGYLIEQVGGQLHASRLPDMEIRWKPVGVAIRNAHIHIKMYEHSYQ
jgi:hypothetical protein